MTQTQTRARAREAARPAAKAGSAPRLADRGEALTAHADRLLDEIDGILEENAEQFVQEYIQRGGE